MTQWLYQFFKVTERWRKVQPDEIELALSQLNLRGVTCHDILKKVLENRNRKD